MTSTNSLATHSLTNPHLLFIPQSEQIFKCKGDAPLFCSQGEGHILSPMKGVPLAPHQVWRWMLEMGQKADTKDA